MDFFLIEFISKWLNEGRFPREELRIRWWIAALALIVLLGLAVALAIAALD